MSVDAVVALTPYGRSGPSSRVRVWEWADRMNGRVAVHSYTGQPSWSGRRLIADLKTSVESEVRIRRSWHGATPGTLLLHRMAVPIGRGKVESYLLQSADLGVYDLDDALFCPAPGRSPLRSLWPNPPRAVAAASSADRVIAGNTFIAEWASSLCPDVEIIPSCIEPRRYRTKSNYDARGYPRLGWLGSSSTERYLDIISQPLLRLHRELGARLTVMGAPRPQLGSLEKMVDRVPWSEESQRLGLSEWDYGIMPLASSQWELGKCAYKLLQYGAAGLPVVASPVGANWSILAAVGAPMPRTRSAWDDALFDMATCVPSSRQRLGRALHDHVTASYSFDRWELAWMKAVGLSSQTAA